MEVLTENLKAQAQEFYQLKDNFDLKVMENEELLKQLGVEKGRKQMLIEENQKLKVEVTKLISQELNRNEIGELIQANRLNFRSPDFLEESRR